MCAFQKYYCFFYFFVNIILFSRGNVPMTYTKLFNVGIKKKLKFFKIFMLHCD